MRFPEVIHTSLKVHKKISNKCAREKSSEKHIRHNLCPKYLKKHSNKFAACKLALENVQKVIKNVEISKSNFQARVLSFTLNLIFIFLLLLL